MPRFRILDDDDGRGKRVLLRADLNVPVKDGAVTDATRIERLAPTIEALIENGAKLIVMSPIGRSTGMRRSELKKRAAIISPALYVAGASGDGLTQAGLFVAPVPASSQ